MVERSSCPVRASADKWGARICGKLGHLAAGIRATKTENARAKTWDTATVMTDDGTLSDGKLYVVHSPSKITLSAEAKEMAAMHGMTVYQMAKHLLQRYALGQAGLIQTDPKDMTWWLFVTVIDRSWIMVLASRMATADMMTGKAAFLAVRSRLLVRRKLHRDPLLCSSPMVRAIVRFIILAAGGGSSRIATLIVARCIRRWLLL
jgi:hypothetical protein